MRDTILIAALVAIGLLTLIMGFFTPASVFLTGAAVCATVRNAAAHSGSAS